MRLLCLAVIFAFLAGAIATSVLPCLSIDSVLASEQPCGAKCSLALSQEKSPYTILFNGKDSSEATYKPRESNTISVSKTNSDDTATISCYIQPYGVQSSTKLKIVGTFSNLKDGYVYGSCSSFPTGSIFGSSSSEMTWNSPDHAVGTLELNCLVRSQSEDGCSCSNLRLTINKAASVSEIAESIYRDYENEEQDTISRTRSIQQASITNPCYKVSLCGGESINLKPYPSGFNQTVEIYYRPLASAVITDEAYIFLFNDSSRGGLMLGLITGHYPATSEVIDISFSSSQLRSFPGVQIVDLEDPKGDDVITYSTSQGLLTADLHLNAERSAFAFGPLPNTSWCFDVLVSSISTVNSITFLSITNSTRVNTQINSILSICYGDCSAPVINPVCGASRYSHENTFPYPTPIDDYSVVCGSCECRTPFNGPCCNYPIPLNCTLQTVDPLFTRNVIGIVANDTDIVSGLFSIKVQGPSLATRSSWLSLGLGTPTSGFTPSPTFHYNFAKPNCSCWTKTQGAAVDVNNTCLDTWTLSSNWTSLRDSCCFKSQDDMFLTVYDCSIRAEHDDIVPSPVFEPRPIPDRFTGVILPLLVRFQKAKNVTTPILIFSSGEVFAYISVQDDTYLLTGEITLQVTFISVYPYEVNFTNILSITPLSVRGAGNVTIVSGYPVFGELTDPNLPYVKCDLTPDSPCYQAVIIVVKPDPGTCKLDAVYQLGLTVQCRNQSGCAPPTAANLTINATFTSEYFCPEVTLDTLLDGSFRSYSNNFTSLQQSFIVYSPPTTGSEERLCLLATCMISLQSPGTNAVISNSFFINLAIQNQAGDVVTLYTSTAGACAECGPTNANLVIDTQNAPDTFPSLPPNEAGACVTLTKGSTSALPGAVDDLYPLVGNPTTWNVIATVGVTYSNTKRSSQIDNAIGLYSHVSVIDGSKDSTTELKSDSPRSVVTYGFMLLSIFAFLCNFF